MKKGKTKILTLVGLFIFLALTLVFLAGTATEKQSTAQNSKTKEENTQLNLAQKTERELFSKKLGELRMIIDKFEQKDFKEFKNQTRKGFLLLADLINELPEFPGGLSEDVLEETMQIKRNAEKLVLIEDKEKVVDLIKDSFDEGHDSIEKIEDTLSCEEEISDKFCEKVEKRLAKLEDMTSVINQKNVMSKTKEVFFEFHSLLNFLNREMSKPEFLTLMQKVQQRQQSEQEVNKTEKDKDKDKDKKKDKEEDKDKEKHKCECQ